MISKWQILSIHSIVYSIGDLITADRKLNILLDRGIWVQRLSKFSDIKIFCCCKTDSTNNLSLHCKITWSFWTYWIGNLKVHLDIIKSLKQNDRMHFNSSEYEIAFPYSRKNTPCHMLSVGWYTKLHMWPCFTHMHSHTKHQTWNEMEKCLTWQTLP